MTQLEDDEEDEAIYRRLATLFAIVGIGFIASMLLLAWLVF